MQSGPEMRFYSCGERETRKDSKPASGAKIIPIEHATAVILRRESAFCTAPVRAATAINGKPQLVLITGIRAAQLTVDTEEEIVTGTTSIIDARGRAKQVPPGIRTPLSFPDNSDASDQLEIWLEVIPMDKLREETRDFYLKGRATGRCRKKMDITIIIRAIQLDWYPDNKF